MQEKAWPLDGDVGLGGGWTRSRRGCDHTWGATPSLTQSSPSLPVSFLQRTYIFTFLLSSRVFIPPHDLLARVGQICLEQRQQLEAVSEKVKSADGKLPVSLPLATPLAHARERSMVRVSWQDRFWLSPPWVPP